MKMSVAFVLAAFAAVASAGDSGWRTVARCGVDDWMSFDDNVNLPEEFGDVKIRTDPARGQTKTMVKVEITYYEDEMLEPGTVFASHVHDKPCGDDSMGGSHWLKESDGPDDPSNAVFNPLRANMRLFKGEVKSEFDISRREVRELKSYVIHKNDAAATRILCCDLHPVRAY